MKAMAKPLRVTMAAAIALLAATPLLHTAEPKAAAPMKLSKEVKAFCSNIADVAREQRYALQRKELEQLKADIAAKMVELEQARAAIQEWVERRETFAEAASGSIVEIYSKMRPDAAAGRMEQLEGGLAAAILLKLKPRTAGIILNEMAAEKAAKLTGIMAAAAETGDQS